MNILPYLKFPAVYYTDCTWLHVSNSRIGPLSVGLDKFTVRIYIYLTDWQTNTAVHSHLGLQ